MLIINIIALICSLFFLCIPLVPTLLHVCFTLLHTIPMLVYAIIAVLRSISSTFSCTRADILLLSQLPSRPKPRYTFRSRPATKPRYTFRSRPAAKPRHSFHLNVTVNASCRLYTKRKLWTFRFDLYCNTLCQFRPPG